MVEVSPTAPVRAMELIVILNRCHRFRGFVYQQAHFSANKKSIEVAVRPRKGSVAICSGCHLPAPGYDQMPYLADLGVDPAMRVQKQSAHFSHSFTGRCIRVLNSKSSPRNSRIVRIHQYHCEDNELVELSVLRYNE